MHHDFPCLKVHFICQTDAWWKLERVGKCKERVGAERVVDHAALVATLFGFSEACDCSRLAWSVPLLLIIPNQISNAGGPQIPLIPSGLCYGDSPLNLVEPTPSEAIGDGEVNLRPSITLTSTTIFPAVVVHVDFFCVGIPMEGRNSSCVVATDNAKVATSISMTIALSNLSGSPETVLVDPITVECHA
ncbi:hypothetical protein V6N13_015883 [Hibiscus sabdariffa]